jgi:hypothetical protein
MAERKRQHSETRRRRNQVMIRLDDAELDKLARAAHVRGKSLAGALRQAFLDGFCDCPPRDLLTCPHCGGPAAGRLPNCVPGGSCQLPGCPACFPRASGELQDHKDRCHRAATGGE